MDIQQATLLETVTLYADKTQQQRDIDVTDRMSSDQLSEWQSKQYLDHNCIVAGGQDASNAYGYYGPSGRSNLSSQLPENNLPQ